MSIVLISFDCNRNRTISTVKDPVSNATLLKTFASLSLLIP